MEYGILDSIQNISNSTTALFRFFRASLRRLFRERSIGGLQWVQRLQLTVIVLC